MTGFRMIPQDDRRSLVKIVGWSLAIGIASITVGLAHIHWF